MTELILLLYNIQNPILSSERKSNLEGNKMKPRQRGRKLSLDKNMIVPLITRAYNNSHTQYDDKFHQSQLDHFIKYFKREFDAYYDRVMEKEDY